MKILVLGGNGMLGHQLLMSLSARHVVGTTLRRGQDTYGHMAGMLPDATYFDIEAADFQTVKHAVTNFEPQAVINAIGMIKQRLDTGDDNPVQEINALLPKRLADLCADLGCRLIHVSTDCVFSGKKGMYTESHRPDADDEYGRSKLAGEVTDNGCLTLRTSMIGLELDHKKSLIEWFLAQHDTIKGFRKAVFSGFTTPELARIIEMLLVRHSEKYGLYHVSSDAIDKYTLLTMLRDRLGLDLEILPDDEFVCDRSLDSSRFRGEFEYEPPPWDRMLDELCEQIRARET